MPENLEELRAEQAQLTQEADDLRARRRDLKRRIDEVEAAGRTAPAEGGEAVAVEASPAKASGRGGRRG